LGGNVDMNKTPIPVEITFVDFKCPHCGNAVSFPEQWIGRAQECPTCSQILIVPKQGVEIGAKLPIPFKTSGLLLRRLNPIDFNDLLEIVSDENLVRYQDWYPLDEQEVENWLAGDQKTLLFQRGHVFYLALELLEQPKVIGYVALTYLEKDNSEMSVDVLVNRNYQRRGFGTEAIRGAMQFTFVGLNVRRLCAWCDCRNLAGERLLEKAGLRREGQFIKCKLIKGEWVDSFQYALLQEEYVSAA
jgi:RimJ/RimL family protein N-acetyltransferase